MTTAFLAQFWGVSFFIFSILFLMRREVILGYMKSVLENPGFVFIAGYISISIGIASILVHNVWSMNVAGIITLIGWTSLIKGIVIIGFPKSTKKISNFYKNDSLVTVALFGMMIVGIFLIIRGFGL